MTAKIIIVVIVTAITCFLVLGFALIYCLRKVKSAYKENGYKIKNDANMESKFKVVFYVNSIEKLQNLLIGRVIPELYDYKILDSKDSVLKNHYAKD